MISTDIRVSSVDKGIEDRWIIRTYRDGDIPPIVELINAADAVDGLGRATSVEELTKSYAMPLSDPARQVVVVEERGVEGVASGMIIGYARMLWLDDTASGERIYQIMSLTAHPAARGVGIERALAASLVKIARAKEARPDVSALEKVSLLAGVKEKMSSTRELYKEIGLREIRWAWTMERSLTEPIPEPRCVEGVSLRNYSRPDDNRLFEAAYNASFIDHFEYHAMPSEVFDYMLGTPHVRPELSWLASADDPNRLTGFCLCEINDEENGRSGKQEGWIALLGTVRDWRGKGLGRSLLLQGLHSLHVAGIEIALLGVDSESLTGANRLYESVGFKIRDYDVLCKAPLNEIAL